MNHKGTGDFYYHFFIVTLAGCITRATIFINYTLFAQTPKIGTVVGDSRVSFHHYHVGILLIVLGLLARKNKLLQLFVWVGLGIVIEEWTVLLEDMTGSSPIRYFSAFDLAAGLLIFAAGYAMVMFCKPLLKRR